MIKKLPILILSAGFASILPQTRFASGAGSTARSGEILMDSVPDDWREIESASVIGARIAVYAQAEASSEDVFQKPAFPVRIHADIADARTGLQERPISVVAAGPLWCWVPPTGKGRWYFLTTDGQIADDIRGAVITGRGLTDA